MVQKKHPLLSRKLLITIVFGLIAPVCFKLLNVDTTVSLAALGLAGAYLGSNVLAGKQ